MTDSAGTEPVVQLAGISKEFAATGSSKAKPTLALSDITLDIRSGEFVSLIGPSGCGKSTLLRLIGDLTHPTSGSVQINGKPAGQGRLDRDYGMVFQSPALFDWRKVEENVRLPLEVFGFDRASQAKRSGEMLDLVGLTDFAGHYPYQLSGGMQQRVAIARALAFSPSLLLMDEPFGALDEMTRERMNSELLSIWARTGITVVFVTHSIPEAVFLSTRVAIMSARPGRITRVVDVNLPQPRGLTTRESSGYFSLITEVREALRAGEGDEAQIASAERTAAEGTVG